MDSCCLLTEGPLQSAAVASLTTRILHHRLTSSRVDSLPPPPPPPPTLLPPLPIESPMSKLNSAGQRESHSRTDNAAIFVLPVPPSDNISSMYKKKKKKME
ncbi:hypothetical protein HZH66_002114 [Vespula vulgaris]|uniref:Uncharacterized protein n=1 Tax=Vespula vulgaris TaxID=7454 RepID=A0A834KKG1_VESVU|nr:hypothetical protein HZH66_002114 [Vespula vulgaris]